jgi:hypothetical protein
MIVIAPIDPPAIVEPAHSWYDQYCCNDGDCAPIKVQIHPGGYMLPNGEIVPWNSPSIRRSQDGRFHLCRLQISPSYKPKSQCAAALLSQPPARCLYVPDAGT